MPCRGGCLPTSRRLVAAGAARPPAASPPQLGARFTPLASWCSSCTRRGAAPPRAALVACDLWPEFCGVFLGSARRASSSSRAACACGRRALGSDPTSEMAPSMLVPVSGVTLGGVTSRWWKPTSCGASTRLNFVGLSVAPSSSSTRCTHGSSAAAGSAVPELLRRARIRSLRDWILCLAASDLARGSVAWTSCGG